MLISTLQWSLRASTSTLIWAFLSYSAYAGQDIDGQPVISLGDTVPVDSPGTRYSDLHPCPDTCGDKAPADWTVFTSVDRLKICEEPMLLDFAVFNPLDDPSTTVRLKACTLGNANSTANALFNRTTTPPSPVLKPRMDGRDSSSCSQSGSSASSLVQFLRRGAPVAHDGDLLDILQRVQQIFEEETACDKSVLFGYSNGAVVGVYTGYSFGKTSVSALVQNLAEQVAKNGSSASIAAQLCGTQRNERHTLGVAIDTTGSVATVQRAVVAWAQGSCTSDFANADLLVDLKIWESLADQGISSNSTTNETSYSNSTLSARLHAMNRRGDCTTQTVQPGDGCGTMATKCGISASDFTKYNSATNFCSTLQPNQKVCCSAGTIPTPKKNADGSCFAYKVQSLDTCSAIALSNGLTVDQLEKLNEGGVWGWSGCQNLQADFNMCLSDGTPPLPAPYDNAVCGPVKPGTTAPTNGTKVEDLNPCPLNACCNVWGQCGITPEFCTYYDSPTGNPGYSPPGMNGCVSSCGQDIVNNKTAPSSFGRVGYYESWNPDRPCVNLEAQNANTDGTYTHIHWAFGTVDAASWTPTVNDTFEQFPDFLALSGVKRIVSFGGWGYSTDASTYDILREAMSPTNRVTFANNIVSFLNTNNLDGVDFDWEYPGATDIPGTPPGSPDDGANYLKFLTVLRKALPAGKTMSIAAPASYWYLKSFPIGDMSKIVDYIVYMTYDLHGQWDAGNQYSIDGCPAGNCLRSHVNLTETHQVLSMITKAGVATNKIFVGESSYGRSFNMGDGSCWTEMCTFTGTRLQSDAQKGECTDTAGYISNAEIWNIQQLEDAWYLHYDGPSDSNILTWSDTQWVAYIDDPIKDKRRTTWQGINFLGTVDWAVDLQSYADDGFLDGGDFLYLPPGFLPGAIGSGSCTGSYSTLDAIEADAANIPNNCLAQYILQGLHANLTKALSDYDDLIKNGYDSKFDTYADSVVQSASGQVRDFMLKHGNQYFTCEVDEMCLCCDKCSTLGDGFPGACTYCFTDGPCTTDKPENRRSLVARVDRPTPGQNGGYTHFEYKKTPEPCPPDYSKRGLGQGQPDVDSVYWTLPPDKHDAFYADIYNTTGISEDNISLQDIHRTECAPSDTQEECSHHMWDYGIPAPNGYNKSDVLNPKDTVAKAHDNLVNMGPSMDSAITAIINGPYMGDPWDLVDAVAMPVFMVQDSIDSMNDVVHVADEIDRAKQMAIIFAFLTAIFFFIPVAGEIASEITAMAGIARIASLLGALGNAAMDVYQLVDTKGNAPLAIFDLIMAPLALTDLATVGKAASIRRGMSDADVGKLGKTGDKMKQIDRIKSKGICKLAKRELFPEIDMVEAWSVANLTEQETMDFEYHD